VGDFEGYNSKIKVEISGDADGICIVLLWGSLKSM
jgi:hypothetical protein